MIPTCRVSLQAVDELRALAAHLAADSPAAALRLVESAQATFQSLAGSPVHGEQIVTRHAHLQGLRLWHITGFPNHLFLYRPLENGIEVERVFHGRSNWQTIL